VTHVPGKDSPDITLRLEIVIRTCFERCPSAGFQLILVVVREENLADQGQRWTRHGNEIMDDAEMEGLWARDW